LEIIITLLRRKDTGNKLFELNQTNYKLLFGGNVRSCSGSISSCQSPEPVSLTLEVISTAPKAFIIPNFLNHFEADQIIKYADPKLGELATTCLIICAFVKVVYCQAKAW
jgi:hypothetical protein